MVFSLSKRLFDKLNSPAESLLQGCFHLDTKENPRLCRGDTKAYGVEESKKEKVSKLE